MQIQSWKSIIDAQAGIDRLKVQVMISGIAREDDVGAGTAHPLNAPLIGIPADAPSEVLTLVAGLSPVAAARATRRRAFFRATVVDAKRQPHVIVGSAPPPTIPAPLRQLSDNCLLP